MAITYKVSEDGTLVWTRVSRDVSEEEILNHAAALVSDSRIKAGFRELVDATATKDAQFSRDAAAKLMEVHREHVDRLRGSRRALVVQDLRVYETAKLMEEMHEGLPVIIVFYSMDVAKIWLGCDTEQEPPDEPAP